MIILPWQLLTGVKHRIQGAKVQSSPCIDCNLNAWLFLGKKCVVGRGTQILRQLQGAEI